MLADYRMLWLDLCHLATYTGFAYCYTYGLYLTHQFFMLALSTYATLSDIMFGTLGNNILVAMSVFVTGFMMVAMCEGADDVVIQVSADTPDCHFSHSPRFKSKTSRSGRVMTHRYLLADLLLQGSGYVPRLVCVGFVVDTVVI
jgi:hypothetical protein